MLNKSLYLHKLKIEEGYKNVEFKIFKIYVPFDIPLNNSLEINYVKRNNDISIILFSFKNDTNKHCYYFNIFNSNRELVVTYKFICNKDIFNSIEGSEINLFEMPETNLNNNEFNHNNKYDIELSEEILINEEMQKLQYSLYNCKKTFFLASNNGLLATYKLDFANKKLTNINLVKTDLSYYIKINFKDIAFNKEFSRILLVNNKDSYFSVRNIQTKDIKEISKIKSTFYCIKKIYFLDNENVVTIDLYNIKIFDIIRLKTIFCFEKHSNYSLSTKLNNSQISYVPYIKLIGKKIFKIDILLEKEDYYLCSAKGSNFNDDDIIEAINNKRMLIKEEDNYFEVDTI